MDEDMRPLHRCRLATTRRLPRVRHEWDHVDAEQATPWNSTRWSDSLGCSVSTSHFAVCHARSAANVLSLSRRVPSRAGQTDTRTCGARGGSAAEPANGTRSAAASSWAAVILRDSQLDNLMTDPTRFNAVTARGNHSSKCIRTVKAVTCFDQA